jgi:hypothetical protein
MAESMTGKNDIYVPAVPLGEIKMIHDEWRKMAPAKTDFRGRPIILPKI